MSTALARTCARAATDRSDRLIPELIGAVQPTLTARWPPVTRTEFAASTATSPRITSTSCYGGWRSPNLARKRSHRLPVRRDFACGSWAASARWRSPTAREALPNSQAPPLARGCRNPGRPTRPDAPRVLCSAAPASKAAGFRPVILAPRSTGRMPIMPPGNAPNRPAHNAQETNRGSAVNVTSDGRRNGENTSATAWLSTWHLRRPASLRAPAV